MKFKHISFLICAFILIWPCDSSNILILLPMPSKSHKIAVDALMDGLSKRDHKITEVTTYTTAKPHENIKSIVLPKMKEIYERYSSQSFFSNSSTFAMLSSLSKHMAECADTLLTDPAFIEFKKNPGHYDVVITTTIMNDVAYSLIPIIAPQTPIILLSPSMLFSSLAWDLNVPTPMSYVPVVATPFDSKMTFIQRVIIVLASGMFHVLFSYMIGPAAYNSVKNHLPDADVSYPSEVVKNVSLVLVNSHFSLGGSKPSMPYIVDVGGMHCQPAKKLPEEFLNFVEGAGDAGFIVFSLGSLVQAKFMPKNLIDSFKYAFKEISPVRVIWKYEEPLEGLSPNVFLSKWIPQQDLIGHPKCRLAITHGGLLSLQEVNYHGVPILGVPLGMDRDSNLKFAVSKGIAQTLEKDEISPQGALETIKLMLEDKSFKENAAKFGQLVRDRPQSPIDTATYWVEYVIRHKGAPHLKSEAENLNLIQYLSIDVFAFLTTILAAILYAIYFVCKFCFRKIFSKKTRIDSKNRNNKIGMSKKKK